MSSIKAASGLIIGGGLSANLEPPPKPVIKEISPNEPAPVKLPAENLSNVLSARVGLDAGDLLKAKINALIDQAQETVTQFKFKPSDMAGPVMLEPTKMLENVKGMYEQTKVAALSDLDENDSIRIGGKGGISGELLGGAQDMSYEIKCTKKDAQTGAVEYTVSVDVSPEFKAKLGDFEASAGAGTKLEYKFKSADEVERFQRLMNQSNLMYLNKDAGKMTPEDRQFLKDRMSSFEVKLTAGGQYESLFGAKDIARIGAQTGVKIQNSFKIEYQDGQPVNLVRTTEITGSGAGRIGLSPTTAKTKTGDGKTSISMETKIPLDATKITDLPTLLADPISAARLEQAETTIKSVTEIDGGRYGTIDETEISHLSVDDAAQIVEKTLLGKPEEAFEGIKAEVKTKSSRFEDSGLNINIDFEFKGFGFEYEARNEKRDVTLISSNQ